MNENSTLPVMLRALKLPSFVQHHAEVARTAEKQGWTFEQYLQHLAEIEHQERKLRRIEKNLRASELPREKTLGQLNLERLPTVVRRQLPTLCEGGFADRAENILLFGLPGRGKSHTACAIGHELVRRGLTVHFTPAFKVVQRLLAAKRDLKLERELRRLDAFDVLILDDIGYIQQDRDEMEVLFTLLAERYERRSVVITSNLVFSQWDRIFKDPMTTAAAIDRMVHHAVILDMTGKSKRAEDALERNGFTVEAGA
ncbi:MAG: IS21-like element helper ATPase IstB [Myxococcota bacterium]